MYDLLTPTYLDAAMSEGTIVLICYGKATHLETLERKRCRTVLVANRDGQCCVNHVRGAQPEVAGKTTGPVADRIDAYFAGLLV